MDHEDMFKDQIKRYYSNSDLQNYEPLTFTDFDTIQRIEATKGKPKEYLGIVVHRYLALDENGDTAKYEETFNVILYPDAAVAIPRGY